MGPVDLQQVFLTLEHGPSGKVPREDGDLRSGFAEACGLAPLLGQPIGTTHRLVSREVTSITSVFPVVSSAIRYDCMLK
jgi:hypothetical protein